MKTISIRQPWAWAILHAGKDIENRTWVTLHRGPTLIHSGKTYDKEGHKYIEDILGIPVPDKLPRGGILGIVDITGCVLQGDSKWFCGPIGFILENARELPFRPYKGRLGLFDVPTHEAYIRETSDCTASFALCHSGSVGAYSPRRSLSGDGIRPKIISFNLVSLCLRMITSFKLSDLSVFARKSVFYLRRSAYRVLNYEA